MTRRFNGCLHKQRRPGDPGWILNLVRRFSAFHFFFFLFFVQPRSRREKMPGRETRRALFPKTYGFALRVFISFFAYCARCVQCAAPPFNQLPARARPRAQHVGIKKRVFLLLLLGLQCEERLEFLYIAMSIWLLVSIWLSVKARGGRTIFNVFISQLGVWGKVQLLQCWMYCHCDVLPHTGVHWRWSWLPLENGTGIYRRHNKRPPECGGRQTCTFTQIHAGSLVSTWNCSPFWFHLPTVETERTWLQRQITEPKTNCSFLFKCPPWKEFFWFIFLNSQRHVDKTRRRQTICTEYAFALRLELTMD